jgi:hypothetical protein
MFHQDLSHKIIRFGRQIGPSSSVPMILCPHDSGSNWWRLCFQFLSNLDPGTLHLVYIPHSDYVLQASLRLARKTVVSHSVTGCFFGLPSSRGCERRYFRKDLSCLVCSFNLPLTILCLRFSSICQMSHPLQDDCTLLRPQGCMVNYFLEFLNAVLF